MTFIRGPPWKMRFSQHHLNQSWHLGTGPSQQPSAALGHFALNSWSFNVTVKYVLTISTAQGWGQSTTNRKTQIQALPWILSHLILPANSILIWIIKRKSVLCRWKTSWWYSIEIILWMEYRYKATKLESASGLHKHHWITCTFIHFLTYAPIPATF